ncbi:hypothetical protein SARC_04553 [Sphaeroforma arctica JP610]|uniref:C2 domain-containing protein n=1 Tax=Sphaeroforma arctica JP610 TaxID=667725 RepID=A0A0L0G2Z1_9EUKA|nr:hypothetical protein SARC_04553 [Sphaeroforma arctica JP610]KNC83186.1 hypothetical protein SARC_04553 [Sphaeroforma arctica JP610]|eukprot:XP_014157088.1 hypothetical protein SARC_04553 [Sphaeroforma arctica JP610]
MSSSRRQSQGYANSQAGSVQNGRKVHPVAAASTSLDDVEKYFEQLANSLGLLNTSLRLQPNGFWLIRDNVTQYVDAPKRLDMNKLARMTTLAKDIIKGQTGVEVVERLSFIRDSEPSWPLWISIFTQPLYACGFCVFFFSGDSKALLASAITGLMSGCVLTIMIYGYLRPFITTFPFLTALSVGFIAGMLAGSGTMEGPCAFAYSLASTAGYFPGVSLTFSVVEISYGIHVTGAVRYIYAVVSGQAIAVGLYLGNLLAVDYIYGDAVNIMVTGTCETGLTFSNQYRLLFYVFLYVGAVIVYEIPRRFYLPFLGCQGSTYFAYYGLTKYGNLNSGLATFIAVLLMVAISAIFSQYAVRRFMRAKMLVPAVLMVPTIELLVPGSSVVRQMYLTLLGDPGEASQQNYVYYALCITFGILLGEAILTVFNQSVFSVPKFRGALNSVPDNTLNDPLYMRTLMPDQLGYSGCLMMVHKAHRVTQFKDKKLVADPYVVIEKEDGELVGRTRTVYDGDEAHWDEAFIMHIPPEEKSSYQIKVMGHQALKNDIVIGSLDVDFCINDARPAEPEPEHEVEKTAFERTFSKALQRMRTTNFLRTNSMSVNNARTSTIKEEDSGPPHVPMRSLVINGVPVLSAPYDVDLNSSSWQVLNDCDSKGQLLVSFRWFTADALFDFRDNVRLSNMGSDASLGSKFNVCFQDSTPAVELANMPSRFEDQANTLSSQTEQTLAERLDTMRLQVLDKTGEYIPPLSTGSSKLLNLEGLRSGEDEVMVMIDDYTKSNMQINIPRDAEADAPPLSASNDGLEITTGDIAREDPAAPASSPNLPRSPAPAAVQPHPPSSLRHAVNFLLDSNDPGGKIAATLTQSQLASRTQSQVSVTVPAHRMETSPAPARKRLSISSQASTAASVPPELLLTPATLADGFAVPESVTKPPTYGAQESNNTSATSRQSRRPSIQTQDSRTSVSTATSAAYQTQTSMTYSGLEERSSNSVRHSDLASRSYMPRSLHRSTTRGSNSSALTGQTNRSQRVSTSSRSNAVAAHTAMQMESIVRQPYARVLKRVQTSGTKNDDIGWTTFS